MKITPCNILSHELIGLEVEVLDSRNKSQVGIKGIVLDETMYTLVIGIPGKFRKVILKKIAVFKFRLPDGTLVKVEGKYLVGRPEDRLKKRLRLW